MMHRQQHSELRIGLIGARAGALAAAVNTLPGARVFAVCDVNDLVLHSLGEQYGVRHRCRDVAELVALDLDAVIVATPMHLHVAHSVLALQAGKAVLCEVTAAVSIEECRQLLATVHETHGLYMLSENYCYRRDCVLLRVLAREGFFGDLYYAEGGYIHDCRHLHYHQDGTSTWRAAWQVGRRAATYTTHSLGPVLHWLDDRVATVNCLGSGVHAHPEMVMDDTVTMLCTTRSGALIDIRCDMQSHRPHQMTHYALQGTHGAYVSGRHEGEPALVWFEGRSGKREQWQSLSEYDAYLPEAWRRVPKAGTGHGGSDYHVVADFIEHVRTGTQPEIDVYRALDFTLPGLVSEQSLAAGGTPVLVPDPRLW